MAPVAGLARSSRVTDAPRFASWYAMLAPRMPPPAIAMRRRAWAWNANGLAPATATPPNSWRSSRRCILNLERRILTAEAAENAVDKLTIAFSALSKMRSPRLNVAITSRKPPERGQQIEPRPAERVLGDRDSRVGVARRPFRVDHFDVGRARRRGS